MMKWPIYHSIPVYTYLLIPMKPHNKTCTVVSEGSREYPHKLSNQHFLRDQRLKFKECDLSLSLSDEAIKHTL